MKAVSEKAKTGKRTTISAEQQYYNRVNIKPEDAKIGMKIWSHNRAQQAGRLTRPLAQQVIRMEPSQVAESIIGRQPYTNMAMDYLYIMGAAFLHSMSIEFQFGITKAIIGKRKPNKEDIENGVKKAINIFEKKNIKVVQAVADNEFECIREAIRPT
mmetsp:Transcript_17140/g.24225  ORF Transcript_17140/g.24225 Transcript_17140/m.24225 type:complete len:157 (+) Transcript_17140:1721-2191(+)